MAIEENKKRCKGLRTSKSRTNVSTENNHSTHEKLKKITHEKLKKIVNPNPTRGQSKKFWFEIGLDLKIDRDPIPDRRDDDYNRDDLNTVANFENMNSSYVRLLQIKTPKTPSPTIWKSKNVEKFSKDTTVQR